MKVKELISIFDGTYISTPTEVTKDEREYKVTIIDNDYKYAIAMQIGISEIMEATDPEGEDYDYEVTSWDIIMHRDFIEIEIFIK